MEKQVKCFSKKHEESDAVIYCQNCRIYMCNKCKKLHSDLFENHILFSLDKDISNIFTGFCKEQNHNCELEYLCTTHNILCCSKCVSSFKNNGYGKHGDCEVEVIEDIKKDKKDNLNKNLKSLEELNTNIKSQIEELNKIYDKIVEDKEAVKLKIQKIYTQLRNMINEQEDKLLFEIDRKFKKIYFKEKFVKQCAELPKKIKNTLIEGNAINKEWDEKKLNYLINGCINIENNIETINQMNKAINNHKLNKIKVKFVEDEEKVIEFSKILKTTGNIFIGKDFNFQLRECPSNIAENKKYKITGKNQNIVQKIGKKEWTPILCQNELKKNKFNVWNIKILISKYGSFQEIIVGIASSDFDINSFSYTKCSWNLCFCCSRLFSGEPHKCIDKESGLNFNKDNITLIMNMTNGKLSCFFEGIQEHVLYENIPTEKSLFPIIFLKNKNDKVIINKIDYRPAGKSDKK